MSTLMREEVPQLLQSGNRNLSGGNLEGFDLSNANLIGDQLNEADLSSATLMDVDSYDHWYCVRFDAADLGEAKVDLSYIDKAGLALYV